MTLFELLFIASFLATVGALGYNHHVHPDDGRFLMVTSSSADTSRPIRVVLVQNWFEELERLVPTD